MVDRPAMIGQTGDERESGTRVHGVIHAGGTVTAPKQLNMDDIGTLDGQAIMT